MSKTALPIAPPAAAAGAQTPPELDGRAFASGLIDLMNELLGIIEQETELVGAGKLGPAAALAQVKTDLAGRYLAATVRLKANAPRWLAEDPEMFAALQKRHELFGALLQVNLTVLATAHAVAEGLIRGAAGELSRKAAPQGYGARGNAVAPSRTAQPMALSRAS